MITPPITMRIKHSFGGVLLYSEHKVNLLFV